MIQSFAPDEVTPEQAMQIGEELCDHYLKGDYQYVLAVHIDKEHTHCHVIFNNTNLYNGLSFTTEHNQGRKSERAWAELRQISDELCKEHGLSLIDPKGKGVSHHERTMQKEGKSWKDKLLSLLDEIISYSKSFEDFLKNCTESGIEYVYTPQNKVKLKFRLSGEGQQRFTRADTPGEKYEPEAITETIETAQKKATAAEQVEKFLAARRARRQAELDMLNQLSAKSAELKKKFAVIDTLIDKIKHRDELEPVYKEYQSKSGWAQKRFKKKNADKIEDYEQTVKYIKEHKQYYLVDGKPPTMLDLLEKSNELKSKWNRLNVEHTTFLTKRDTAKKDTRQVRQYINEQLMKREREKSRQRTQTKHKNSYLE